MQTVNPRDMNERDLSSAPKSLWEGAKSLLSKGATWANENRDTIIAGA